jgi:two-component system chemotaxis sensor kinase CheA
VSLSQQDGNKVEICVEDDGAGIDCARVKAVAIKSGLLEEADAGSLDDAGTLPLIFRSGVSTSPIITSLAGRGLGLAIVNEKVEKLGGSVAVDSIPGRGTRIRLLLPATLATFRGTLVRAGDRPFVMPTASVERALRFPADQIQSAANRETIAFAGRPISFVRLADILGIPVPPAAEKNGYVTALVVHSAGRHIGLGVSEVLGEQEILVRSLGPQLAKVRNISGAAMLGSGVLVPILNVADLLRSAIESDGTPRAADGAPGGPAAVKSLLVVEDSVTSRVLLKSILQSSGYEVTTAVDGLDALTALRTTRFDLVVSDVEMPRMNGFELTTRLRWDTAFKDIPIVLVTARESREDKERGIECGANAYVVKSSFDQTNLLSVIEGLL